MHVRYSICVIALFVMTTIGGAQEPPKRIKHAAAQPTSPASGHDMFMSYCASCHGKAARGDGPAASALKIPPTDLTALAKKNDGKYPSLKVTAVLSGQTDLASHGNKDMPVWGVVFRSMSGGHESEVQQRVANLNHYLESLQAK
jgi:mono/diheme cytochrome c family protein